MSPGSLTDLLIRVFTLRVISVKGIAIDLRWSDRKLERSCSDDARGRKRWGADQWALLKRRLASLAAAPTLRHMDGVPGRCHALRGDRAGQFALQLWGPYRLIFSPDHDPVPRLADGGIDRALVTAIRMEEILDYHGK